MTALALTTAASWGLLLAVLGGWLIIAAVIGVLFGLAANWRDRRELARRPLAPVIPLQGGRRRSRAHRRAGAHR